MSEPDNDFKELDNIQKEGEAVVDGPEAEPEPEMSPEDRHQMIIEKTKLKNKVIRYKTLFPKILGHFEYRMAELDVMSIPELEYLIQELSVAVNTQNSSGLTKMLYFGSVRFVEASSSIFGLQINGLSAALNDNEAVHDVLNEISLKYENDMYMAPEIRLAYLTAQTMLGLHNLNSSGNTINAFLQSKIPETIADQYKDL